MTDIKSLSADSLVKYVDKEWYLQTNNDVFKAGADAVEHFIAYGHLELRSPNKSFSSKWYVDTYMASEIGEGPVFHYEKIGKEKGYYTTPDPISKIKEYFCGTGLFDEEYYLLKNPDIAAAGINAFDHFMRYGWKEVRNPSSDFDVVWYTLNYNLGDFNKNPFIDYYYRGRQNGFLTRPQKTNIKKQEKLSSTHKINRICLFAGYDKECLIRDTTLTYIRELSRHSDVYYLSDNPLLPSEKEKILPYVKGVWGEKHSNYDFGSWSLLAKKYVGWDVLSSYDEVLFVNDSCFLVNDLDDLFLNMDARNCDWWGLQATKGIASTIAKQKLQSVTKLDYVKENMLSEFEQDETYDFLIGSYFLGFRKKIINDKNFQSIINNVSIDSRKLRTILKYEIGITRWLISSGYDFDCFVENVYPHQPIFTEEVWSLIKDGFPLLKKYFLENNHYNYDNIVFWKRELGLLNVKYNIDDMERDLYQTSNYLNMYKLYDCIWPDGLVTLPPRDIRSIDKAAPKYENWWCFPVCAFTKNLDDNVRGLFEKVKNDQSIKKIVLVRENYIPVDGKNVHIVPLKSIEGIFYLIRCKQIFLKHSRDANVYWQIDHTLHNIYNLWHGIPLKRIGYVSLDREHKREITAKENKETTAVISASEVDRLAMAAAYWPLTYHDIWLTGLPRHDFINCEFDDLPAEMQAEENRVRKSLNGKELILYAPTFRNKQAEGYYIFSEDEKNALQKVLVDNNFILGIREHMADVSKTYNAQLSGLDTLNLSLTCKYIEVLYRVASVLITDYSSCFIDFLQTKKPVLSFAFDFAEYTGTERGLFYNMEWCFPGVICKTFPELLKAISDLPNNPYKEDIYQLKSQLFSSFFDTNNSQRVIEKMSLSYSDKESQEKREFKKIVVFVYKRGHEITARYRIFNIISDLKKMGWTCLVLTEDAVKKINAINPDIIVLMRLSISPSLIDIVEAAKKRLSKVFYDIDDLVFSEKALWSSEYFTKRPERWNDIRVESKRISALMNICDAVIVTTNQLYLEVSKIGLDCIVSPNTISANIINKYLPISMQAHTNAEKKIKICYLSGTKTHASDFMLCYKALKEILHNYKSVEVHIVGQVTYEESENESMMQGFFYHNVMSYDEMHAFLQKMDINLAPLVNSEFNDAKSELKIFEAAVHAVPTIASATDSYSRCINNGHNGIVVNNQSDWMESILSLILDDELRMKMGMRAAEEIVPAYKPEVAAKILDQFFISKV